VEVEGREEAAAAAGKKLTRSHPSRPGFPGPIPKRVFASTQTGPRPGSTHRADPGFKTLLFFTLHLMLHEFIYFLVSQMLFLICF
jgi:hypothetical protein